MRPRISSSRLGMLLTMGAWNPRATRAFTDSSNAQSLAFDRMLSFCTKKNFPVGNVPSAAMPLRIRCIESSRVFPRDPVKANIMLGMGRSSNGVSAIRAREIVFFFGPPGSDGPVKNGEKYRPLDISFGLGSTLLVKVIPCSDTGGLEVMRTGNPAE